MEHDRFSWGTATCTLLRAQVQIARREQREVLQRLEVADGQRPFAQHNEIAGAQLLDGAVDVHDRTAGRIGQIHLGDRKAAALAAFQQSDRPQPLEDFAEQMGDPLQGDPPSQIDRPFPLDRHAYQRLDPEYRGERPVGGQQFLEASGLHPESKSRPTSPQWRDRWPD